MLTGRLGLKRRVLILVLLVLIPAFGLLFHSYFQHLRAARAVSSERAIAQAKIGASIQKFYLKQAEQLLNTLSQMHFLVFATHYGFATNHFINLTLLSPDYHDFGLIENDGKLFCDTKGTPRGDTEKHAGIFAAVNSSRTFTTLLHNPTNEEHIVVCGIPLFDNKTNFSRVLFASIKLSVLTEALNDSPLSQRQEIFLFDSAGARLGETAAALTPEKVSLEKLSTASSRDGAAWESRALDGEYYIYGASEVKHGSKPVYFVGIKSPRKEAFAAANRGLRQNLFLLACAALLVLFLSRFWANNFLVKPITQVASAAGRLQGGDLTARTGIEPGNSEIHQLAKAFDKMAISLAEREKELRVAYDRIAEVNSNLERRVEERTSELKTLNQELEAFSYSVSHDLRAPLRHIGGFAEFLHENEAIRGNEKARKQLEAILAASRKMTELIDDLLSFSRMAREKMMVSSVDMNRIVQRIIVQTRENLNGRNVQFELRPLDSVTGDPSMLTIVWENLVSNAVKYSRGKDPAIVIISSEKAPGEVIFSIQDNGTGFDMQFAENLFGVFQRLHRNEEFEGTGIGLANVRRIIHRHGGRTWAEGKQGLGAKFYFSLPTNGDSDQFSKTFRG